MEEGQGCCFTRGCSGILEYLPVQDCSCFQLAPCSACEDNPLVCEDCGANSVEDEEVEAGTMRDAEALDAIASRDPEGAWARWKAAQYQIWLLRARS